VAYITASFSFEPVRNATGNVLDGYPHCPNPILQGEHFHP